jgi:hypothetical protein
VTTMRDMLLRILMCAVGCGVYECCRQCPTDNQDLRHRALVMDCLKHGPPECTVVVQTSTLSTR